MFDLKIIEIQSLNCSLIIINHLLVSLFINYNQGFINFSFSLIISISKLFKYQKIKICKLTIIHSSAKQMQDEKTRQPIKSKSIAKSSLNPLGGQNSRNIEYVKQTTLNDKVMQISDEQKQQEMNKMRDEYIQEKLKRKNQMIKIKKEEFGSSSSEDDDVGVGESQSGQQGDIQPDIHQGIRKYSDQEPRVQDETDPLTKPFKVYQLKGKQNWTELTLLLKQKSIFLQDQEFELSKIHKIKSIPVFVSKNLLKIKLSYNTEQIMLAAAKQLIAYKKQKLPLHYITFASIIIKKLAMMGLKFYQLEKNVPGVPESIIKNCLIYGKIFKKSQILGRWEERLIVINEMGMYSYKRFNEQHSMFIAAKSVKQIWTRFEIVDQNLLVIKILHSSNTKTEFGIPITDFMNEKNWLYQFYQMGISQTN